MTDGSKNYSGLREEWSLLVHSIIDDSEADDLKNENINLQKLTIEQIKTFKRDLSQQRNQINLKIEEIKNRIDEALSVIENLELVGSNAEEYKKEVEQLNSEGEKVSALISEIDLKLNKIRDIETKLIQLTEASSA